MAKSTGSAVCGGSDNHAFGDLSYIGGGDSNSIDSAAINAVISGGGANQCILEGCVISGGSENYAEGRSPKPVTFFCFRAGSFTVCAVEEFVRAS